MKTKLLALLALALLGLSACTDADGTRRTLSAQGYTDIEITGFRPFMKGKDDTFSTGFKAKSPGGQVVTGAVTRGYLKGSTIRLD